MAAVDVGVDVGAISGAGSADISVSVSVSADSSGTQTTGLGSLPVTSSVGADHVAVLLPTCCHRLVVRTYMSGSWDR